MVGVGGWSGEGESPLAPSESTAAALCVDDGAADGSRDGAVTAGRQSAAGSDPPAVLAEADAMATSDDQGL